MMLLRVFSLALMALIITSMLVPVMAQESEESPYSEMTKEEQADYLENLGITGIPPGNVREISKNPSIISVDQASDSIDVSGYTGIVQVSIGIEIRPASGEPIRMDTGIVEVVDGMIVNMKNAKLENQNIDGAILSGKGVDYDFKLRKGSSSTTTRINGLDYVAKPGTELDIELTHGDFVSVGGIYTINGYYDKPIEVNGECLAMSEFLQFKAGTKVSYPVSYPDSFTDASADNTWILAKDSCQKGTTCISANSKSLEFNAADNMRLELSPSTEVSLQNQHPIRDESQIIIKSVIDGKKVDSLIINKDSMNTKKAPLNLDYKGAIDISRTDGSLEQHTQYAFADSGISCQATTPLCRVAQSLGKDNYLNDHKTPNEQIEYTNIEGETVVRYDGSNYVECYDCIVDFIPMVVADEKGNVVTKKFQKLDKTVKPSSYKEKVGFALGNPSSIDTGEFPNGDNAKVIPIYETKKQFFIFEKEDITGFYIREGSDYRRVDNYIDVDTISDSKLKRMVSEKVGLIKSHNDEGESLFGLKGWSDFMLKIHKTEELAQEAIGKN